MTTHRIAAWLLLGALSTAALAESPLAYPDVEDAPPAVRPSPMTRAQFAATYLESLTAKPEEVPASTLTRAAVVAEYFRARDRGELAIMDEDSGSAWLSQTYAHASSARRVAQLRTLALRD
jgi:hypothetical protein